MPQLPVLNPFWVSGFIEGEGSFHVSIAPAANAILGFFVRLEFAVGQHIRDELLMRQFITFFGCGIVTVYSKRNFVEFRIRNCEDIGSNLIPFLEQYPLITMKRFDFEDFKRIHAIVVRKEHLTLEGLNTIRSIAKNMNRNRSF